jgi:hypothetical protein
MEMRKCVTAFAIVAAATISTAAFAAKQDNGPWVMQGVGADKCTKFNSNTHKASEWLLFYQTWAQGVISGFNYATFKENGSYRDMHSIEGDDQRKILITYCLAHPQEEFFSAVDELYGQLVERKGKQEQGRVD